MQRRSPAPAAILAAALLLALFAVLVQRARVQSVTCDEALSYGWFLKTPWSETFAFWDANNHVLHTLLAKLSLRVFGVSELSLRGAALLGAALTLSAALLLCRRLLGDGLAMLLGLALVVLNPLLLDYLCAARGYGLALGFLLWAAFWLGGDPPRERLASLALGLSVASSLAFLWPATALLFAALVEKRAAARARLVDLAAPGLGVAALLLAPALLGRVRLADFYAGAESLGDAVRDVATATLFHHAFDGPAWIGGYDWGADVATAAVPGAALAAALVGAMAATLADRSLRLLAGAWLGAVALAVLAHVAIGLRYPYARSALYAFPLLVLALGRGLVVLANQGSRRLAIALVCVAGISVATVFGLQFQTRLFRDYVYDASAREVHAAIRNCRARSPRPLRLGGPVYFKPALEYYASVSGTEPLSYVEAGPESAASFDLFVMGGGEAEALARSGFAVAYRDPISGVMLFERRS